MGLIYKSMVCHLLNGVVLIPLLFNVAVIYSGSNPMSVLNNKPLFNLSIEAINARYFIYLNGMLMHKEFSSEGQISTALPVNHWMHPSDNIMAIEVFPEHDGTVRKSARVKVELQVHSEAVAGSRHTVATIDFQQKYADDSSPTKHSSPKGRYRSEERRVGKWGERGDAQEH